MCVVCTVAPPIEIFFPPFGKMIQNLQDPNFKPQAEHIQIAADIVKRAGVIMTTECTYMSIVQEKLQDLLNARFQNVCKDSGSSPYDGLSGSDAYPFVVLALKRMLGEGSCDPLVEAEYSVLRMWYERKDEREKCCCPTLILAGGGPNLCLAGAVFTDRFIVQRLSDTIFMAQASTSADELIFRVACFISVFENGILELKDFYANLKTKEVKALVPGKPHPRFFPQPTSFLGRDGKVVEFVYERGMDDDAQNVTFLVHTKESQKKLIVKFVARYGYEAHGLLAEKDFAPKLHYCGLLDGKTDVQNYPEAQGTIRTDALGLYRGPTRMVVMDFLDGRSAIDSPPPPNARKDIKTALDILHGNGFVFGDLREPNIVYHKASDGKYKAKLIDFDWCGKEGVAFYPPGLAKELFPSGPLTEIKKAHDIVMFTKLFPAEY
ncbi:hypothetical protein K435DRAFT_652988 [Dendrothele bispora CBS 962.96]|uniref:Protein kinase domain-containing protein n=1 Tax=Dendrothele bispora (strain CBS 962.96) TaxID=1314807 RepID=A0A4S8MJB5_DENBC|nr:hypothetical protein K435DRAFT_652988 [Dendrothele bispora CBS 962.96]